MKKRQKKLNKKRIVRDNFRYKLTESELDRMTFRGVISSKHRDLLIGASRLREPSTYARQRFQVALNGRGTIMLNSINFYGGENFNEPYHFLGEITNKTSPSVFKRFMRSNLIPMHPFKD